MGQKFSPGTWGEKPALENNGPLHLDLLWEFLLWRDCIVHVCGSVIYGLHVEVRRQELILPSTTTWTQVVRLGGNDCLLSHGDSSDTWSCQCTGANMCDKLWSKAREPAHLCKACCRLAGPYRTAPACPRRLQPLALGWKLEASPGLELISWCWPELLPAASQTLSHYIVRDFAFFLPISFLLSAGR